MSLGDQYLHNYATCIANIDDNIQIIGTTGSFILRMSQSGQQPIAAALPLGIKSITTSKDITAFLSHSGSILFCRTDLLKEPLVRSVTGGYQNAVEECKHISFRSITLIDESSNEDMNTILFIAATEENKACMILVGPSVENRDFLMFNVTYISNFSDVWNVVSDRKYTLFAFVDGSIRKMYTESMLNKLDSLCTEGKIDGELLWSGVSMLIPFPVHDVIRLNDLVINMEINGNLIALSNTNDAVYLIDSNQNVKIHREHDERIVKLILTNKEVISIGADGVTYKMTIDNVERLSDGPLETRGAYVKNGMFCYITAAGKMSYVKFVDELIVD